MSFSDKFWESLTNKEGRTNRNVSICYKHIPLDCLTIVLSGGIKVPTEPPSVFGRPRSVFLARLYQNCRVNQKRKTLHQKPVQNRLHWQMSPKTTIDTFYGLVWYCNRFTLKNCVKNSAPGVIKILKFNKRFPPDIEYSLLIQDSFHVNAYRGQTKVACKDLINGFHSYPILPGFSPSWYLFIALIR